MPGGFNQPATWKFYRGMAFSKVATGVTRKDYVNYTNWQGTKTPSILQWYPQLDVGTYTGQSQAAWTINGNNDYITVGGEFPKTDGTAQQGLVRYAKKRVTPDTEAPELSGANFLPTVTSRAAGEASVSWQSTFDRDNRNLTYKVYRDNNTTTPVYTVTQGSNPWDRPFLNFLDTGVSPGVHTYRVWSSDPSGNVSKGGTVSVTVAGSGAATDAYTKSVLQDGPESLWRLDEASGTSLSDYTGYDDMTATSGITPGAAGAITGRTAATMSGSGTAASTIAQDGPWWFTVEAWVKTTSATGGRIVGFSGSKTGSSASNKYDRVLYMSSNGRLNFGVMQGTGKNTLTSTASYNNGAWHHVVGVVGDSGMNLYVDGARVGQRTDIHTAGSYVGYWRIGGDTLSGWTNAPATTNPVAGQIDEVAVYQSALSGDQVRAHYVASGRTVAGTPTPSDTYGKAVYDDGPDLYWRLAESQGSTTAADSSQNGNTGAYANSPTLGGSSAVGVATDKSMGTDGVNDNVAQNTTTAGTFGLQRGAVVQDGDGRPGGRR